MRHLLRPIKVNGIVLGLLILWCAGCGDDETSTNGADGQGGAGASSSAGGGDTGGASAGPVDDWIHTFGDVEDDEGNAVQVDASGNSYIIGELRGTADLGGGALVSAGSADVVVASYDRAGEHRWSKRFGGGGQDIGWSLALDPMGGLWIAGQFQQTVSFGGADLTYVGATDGFVAHLDGTGEPTFAAGFGGEIVDVARSIATDSAGNAYVAGTFTNEMTMEGQALSSNGDEDFFVASFEPSGTLRWVRTFGTSEADSVAAIAVAPDGSFYLTGSHAGGLDLGGGALSNAGQSDVFLAKFDAAAEHQWSKSFGGMDLDFAQSVAVKSDRVAITGSFRTSIDFGGGPLTAGLAIFAAGFDTTGEHVWSVPLANQGTSIGRGLAFGTDNTAYVVGSSFGHLELSAIDSSGAVQWTRAFLDSGSDGNTAVATDPAGGVVVTGSFDGDASFADQPVTVVDGYDGFVLRFAQ